LEYGGYKAVKIEVQDKTINIATPGLTLEELNFFFTPETSEVKIINIVEKEKKNYGLLIFYLFLILLFGFLAYFGMEQWYKRKYENYLFKDRNSLYNVMVFVTNEKNEGNSKEEIREKLKKAGWSAEQIRYILRKFHGEETGMKSLHLFDFFKKFKSIKSQKKAPMDEEIYEPQPSKL
jgi:hypothetical protein